MTPRTKAVLVAHLLGTRFDLEPWVEFARQHDLVLFEDCAQAFEGSRYRGHPDADVSMFSFGPIKTATALAGGVLRVRDSSLLERMRAAHASYLVQSRWTFLKRVLFYCVLHWLGGQFVFAAFFQICRLLGKDLDRLLNGSIRNFPQAEFFQMLRRQPSMPLLRLMARRITTYRDAELDQRTARGRLLLGLLPEGSCPGSAADPHSFWVFPVRVVAPAAAIAALHRAGFDATTVNSLRPVEPPADRPELEPYVARTVLSSVIYVPLYAAIPAAEIRRLAESLQPFVVLGAVDEISMIPLKAG